MGMDATVCLRSVMVEEAGVTFDDVEALCAVSLRQESGKSCE